QPADVWRRLSPQLQAQICEELTVIIQEVMYDYIRTHHPSASDPQGYHLYTAVQPRLVKKLESVLKTIGDYLNKTRSLVYISLPEALLLNVHLRRTDRGREAYGLEDPAGVYHGLSRRRTLAAQ